MITLRDKNTASVNVSVDMEPTEVILHSNEVDGLHVIVGERCVCHLETRDGVTLLYIFTDDSRKEATHVFKF